MVYEIDYWSDGKVRTTRRLINAERNDPRLLTMAAIMIAEDDKHFSRIRRITVILTNANGSVRSLAYDHKEGFR